MMNTAQVEKSGRTGRPPKPASEKKVPKSVYLSPKTLERLELLDSNLSHAIEKLASEQMAGNLAKKQNA